MDSQIPAALQPNVEQPIGMEVAPQTSLASAAPAQPTEAPAPQVPTYEMLQAHTNATTPVPHDDVYTAVKSGQYLPKKSDEFVIKDSQGDGRIVTGEYLKQAIDDGFRLESSQEMHDRVLQEQHGNSQAATFVEGAARGALGLTSLASQGLAAATGNDDLAITPDQMISGLNKLGLTHLDPQAMRDRAEANPNSAFLGELAGQTLGPEAKLVNMGVKGLSGVVESTIIKDAAKAGLGKKIAASLAGKIAGGVVEGAYYSTGELMSENSLGKADVNAENLLAAAGMGALFGGTIGGAVGIATEAAPYVVKGAKFVAQPLVKQVEHEIDANVAAGRLLGLTPAQMAKVAERNPNVVKNIQSYLKDDLQLQLGDTAESLMQKNLKLSKAAGQEIESVLNEMDAALTERPDLKPSAKSVWNSIYDNIAGKYDEWFQKDAPAGAEKVRKPVQDFLSDVYRLAQSDAEFGAKDLQKLKRMQDTLMNYEKTPGKWSVFEDLVHDTRSALKEEIDLIADRLHKQGLSGDLSARLKTANRQYSSAATFGDFIEKRALKAGDKTMSLMGTVRDVGLDVKRKLAVLGTIERAQQSMGKLIDGAVKSFVTPVSDAVSKLPLQQMKKAIPASIIDSEFSKRFEDGKYKKPKSVSEAFQNMNDNFSRYGRDPEQFLQRSNRGTAPMYAQAPNTSTALDSLATNAALFLGTKLPKRVSQPGVMGILNNPRPPSTYDLSKFERYLSAVESPKTVFEEMKQGKLSHEGAETLRAVYPNLFSQLQDRVMEELGKNPQMPYSRKLQLGILLDTPTDESLLPENIMGLQASFQTEPDSEQGAIKPTATGMKELGIAERAQTDTQSETDLT